MTELTQNQKNYRRDNARGLYGLKSEPTWDRKRHMHTCCGSKASYRHKVACPRANSDGKLPPE